MPSVQDCPRLRPGLAAAPDRQHPHFIILWDQLGLCRQPQRLNVLEFSSIQMFNGRNTLLRQRGVLSVSQRVRQSSFSREPAATA